MDWVVVLLLGVVAGTVGGIVGFGASIILMPALVWVFGAKDAVPMMAIAALLANASRVAVWWRDVDWRACGVYSITAVPFAALGASTLVVLEARAVEGALGVFFLAMIPVRRWLQSIGLKIVRWHLGVVGIFIGFLSGIVASTGPINTPFFLAYGLVKALTSPPRRSDRSGSGSPSQSSFGVLARCRGTHWSGDLSWAPR